MDTARTSEILTLALLFAGAVSTSYTVRSAANYVNLYDAIASLDLRISNETYNVDSEISASLTFQLRNPTPYQGMRVEDFHLIPQLFRFPAAELAIGLESYTITSLTFLRNVELPAHSTLNLEARFALKGDSVQKFRELYQNQTMHVTLEYEASLRVHTMLDNQCVMTFLFTLDSARATCRGGSFGTSNV